VKYHHVVVALTCVKFEVLCLYVAMPIFYYLVENLGSLPKLGMGPHIHAMLELFFCPQ
jgi:hypothetical protein